MSRSLLLWAVCLQLWTLVSSPDDQLQINANPGDDVTLQCQSPRDEAITVLEWKRADLKTDDDEEFVFYFRDDRLYESFQLPSFRGRVQLRDPKMKDRNLSVILKNVTINDTGTYECRFSVNSAKPELINTINLTVTDSGHTAGNTTDGRKRNYKDRGETDEIMKGYRELTVGLPVTLGICVVFVVIFKIYKKKKQKKKEAFIPSYC